jgi:hypothetical protein
VTHYANERDGAGERHNQRSGAVESAALDAVDTVAAGPRIAAVPVTLRGSVATQREGNAAALGCGDRSISRRLT